MDIWAQNSSRFAFLWYKSHFFLKNYSNLHNLAASNTYYLSNNIFLLLIAYFISLPAIKKHI